MTTIACNLKEMAADSCITLDDIGLGTGQESVKKLHRIGKSIFGERGDNVAGVPVMLEWISKGAKWKKPPELPKGADFSLLELSPKGIFLWGSDMTCEHLIADNYAIGSGGKVALYCMRVLKMSPAQAVAEAIKVDAYSRAPIHTERLK